MSPHSHHTVPEGDAAGGLRLDAYAAQVFAALPSRKQARKAIKAGHLLLNGLPTTSSRFLRPGDQLSLTLPPDAPLPPLAIAVPVVYQDPWLAVVHKPAGMHVRGARARTLHRTLGHNLGPSPLPDALADPDPVHRLDRRTSGLVLVARTAEVRVHLGRLFEQQRIHKRYRAVLLGHLSGDGEITDPIDERPALTRWRALHHHRSPRTGWLTTVDLFPVTGRTHQLRRHMTGLGHPVLGDDLYHNGQILRRCGLFLCAVEQRFVHPLTHHPVHAEIPPPLRFDTHGVREERRWQRLYGEE